MVGRALFVPCSSSSASVTLSYLFVSHKHIQITNCGVQGCDLKFNLWLRQIFFLVLSYWGGQWCCVLNRLQKTCMVSTSPILLFPLLLSLTCQTLWEEPSHHQLCVPGWSQTLNEGVVMLCEGSVCDSWVVHEECRALWCWGVTSDIVCCFRKMM